jgi:polysaccharide export outer membrane protein
VLANAKENVYVQPDDTLYVNKQPRTFLALGATVSSTDSGSARFDFESDQLTLSEAVARAGGLSDSRADSKQVFIYRLEQRESLKAAGADLRKIPPATKLVPTIYRANFADPSVFFAASSFAMRDKDIIYVANAGAVDYLKFLAIVGATTGNYTNFRNAPGMP